MNWSINRFSYDLKFWLCKAKLPHSHPRYYVCWTMANISICWPWLNLEPESDAVFLLPSSCLGLQFIENCSYWCLKWNFDELPHFSTLLSFASFRPITIDRLFNTFRFCWSIGERLGCGKLILDWIKSRKAFLNFECILCSQNLGNNKSTKIITTP